MYGGELEDFPLSSNNNRPPSAASGGFAAAVVVAGKAGKTGPGQTKPRLGTTGKPAKPKQPHGSHGGSWAKRCRGGPCSKDCLGRFKIDTAICLFSGRVVQSGSYTRGFLNVVGSILVDDQPKSSHMDLIPHN